MPPQPCFIRPYYDGRFSVMTHRARMETQVPSMCPGDLEEATVVLRQCWVQGELS